PSVFPRSLSTVFRRNGYNNSKYPVCAPFEAVHVLFSYSSQGRTGKLLTTSAKPAQRTTRPRASSIDRANGASKATLAADTGGVLAENPPSPPALSQREREPSLNGFSELMLSDEVNRAIASMGFGRPTRLQARVIPLLLEGRDAIGPVQTGTAK